MASVFTRIIRGELPARFVYRDEHCVAFLSIAPLRPGHTLVVPILEIEHWLDLPPPVMTHLVKFSTHLGKSMYQAFPCEKIGMIIAGFEIPHVHIHLIPANGPEDLNFENSKEKSQLADLDSVAEKLRSCLDTTLLDSE